MRARHLITMGPSRARVLAVCCACSQGVARSRKTSEHVLPASP
jgi:hypothetical protein